MINKTYKKAKNTDEDTGKYVYMYLGRFSIAFAD